jgi:hypothetical protein
MHVFLIIWGFRVIWSTVGTGVFYCQRCGGDRQYRQRTGRRFFTLYWIPIIPLSKVNADHVQCLTCKALYPLGVLQQATVAQLQAGVAEGIRAMAVVMLQAGDINNVAARTKAVQIVTGGGIAGYHDGALAADLGRPGPEWRPAIQALGGQMQPEAKEWHLAELLRLALVDGPLTDAERMVATGIAGDLGMTPAQTTGVITLMQQAPAPGQEG